MNLSSWLALCLLSSVASAEWGVPARVRFLVNDDQGRPVSNVTVSGCFLDLSQKGMRDFFDGKTDELGQFVATGKTGVGVFAQFTNGGYYASKVQMSVGSKLRTPNEWSPPRWDAEVRVLLKRIRNPTSLRIETVRNPHVGPWETPGKYRISQESAYDMFKSRFLPPHGPGLVADMEFLWKMTIHATDERGLAEDYDTRCEIRMTNACDGICRGIPDGGKGRHRDEGSAYISDYAAPVDGYTNSIVLYRNVRGRAVESNDDQHYLYYFRIRTQTNVAGIVTNALYGKIYGQINGNFTYFLNTTPNDRNVEEERNRY